MKVSAKVESAVSVAVALYPAIVGEAVVNLTNALRAFVARSQGKKESLTCSVRRNKDGAVEVAPGSKKQGDWQPITVDGSAYFWLCNQGEMMELGLSGKATPPADVADWLAKFVPAKSGKAKAGKTEAMPAAPEAAPLEKAA